MAKTKTKNELNFYLFFRKSSLFSYFQIWISQQRPKYKRKRARKKI